MGEKNLLSRHKLWILGPVSDVTAGYFALQLVEN